MTHGEENSGMTFSKLNIDPAHSPGILDTATWDPGAALAWLGSIDAASFADGLRTFDRCVLRCGAQHGESSYHLAGLADGQQAFCALARPRQSRRSARRGQRACPAT